MQTWLAGWVVERQDRSKVASVQFSSACWRVWNMTWIDHPIHDSSFILLTFAHLGIVNVGCRMFLQQESHTNTHTRETPWKLYYTGVKLGPLPGPTETSEEASVQADGIKNTVGDDDEEFLLLLGIITQADSRQADSGQSRDTSPGRSLCRCNYDTRTRRLLTWFGAPLWRHRSVLVAELPSHYHSLAPEHRKHPRGTKRATARPAQPAAVAGWCFGSAWRHSAPDYIAEPATTAT